MKLTILCIDGQINYLINQKFRKDLLVFDFCFLVISVFSLLSHIPTDLQDHSFPKHQRVFCFFLK